MDNESVFQNERFKLVAWSDRLNQRVTLAAYTLYANGLAYIEPTQHGYDHFKHLGLPTKKRFFELDINHDPVGIVAKAFGLDYNDGAVRHRLASLSHGEITGPRVLAMAFEGVPGQMGSLQSSMHPENLEKHIAMRGVIEKVTPILPRHMIVTGTDTSNNMTTKNVLVRDGDEIRHGYIVTLDDIGEPTDRFAIYAAVMNTLSNDRALHSDKTEGIRMTANGLPGLLCLDATRPPVRIKSMAETNSYHKVAVVSTAEYNSRRAHMPALQNLEHPSHQAFENYLVIKTIKNMAQDLGTHNYNTPMIADGMFYSGRLVVASDMDLKRFASIAAATLDRLPEMITREIKLLGPVSVDTLALTTRLENAVYQTVREASLQKEAIDLALDESHIHNRPEEATKRPVRVYDMQDMQV